MGHHGIRGARRSDSNKGDKRPMATTYSPEFKASIIARMLPPHNVPVPDLVRETNIPKDTSPCLGLFRFARNCVRPQSPPNLPGLFHLPTLGHRWEQCGNPGTFRYETPQEIGGERI
jgi:hypothetical protein